MFQHKLSYRTVTKIASFWRFLLKKCEQITNFRDENLLNCWRGKRCSCSPDWIQKVQRNVKDACKSDGSRQKLSNENIFFHDPFSSISFSNEIPIPTSIYLQESISIQPRPRTLKFAKGCWTVRRNIGQSQRQTGR